MRYASRERREYKDWSAEVPRAAEPTADAAAVREFWFNLTEDARLRALRFEDESLADILWSARQTLMMSQMMCKQRGLSAGNAASQASMALVTKGFDFSIAFTSSGIRPVAFFATDVLAKSENLFTLLDEELGGFLKSLPRAPAAAKLQVPNSWRELLLLMLRSVESAVLQMYLAVADQDRVAQTDPEPLEPPLTKAQKARRRRKAALIRTDLNADHCQSSSSRCRLKSPESPVGTDAKSSGESTKVSSSDSSDESRLRPNLSEDEATSCVGAGRLQHAAGDHQACGAEGLRCHWLSNDCEGNAQKWHWVAMKPGDSHADGLKNVETIAFGHLAIVKNTFIDELFSVPETSERPRARARSLDLPRAR